MRTTKIARAKPFSGAPKINLASVFGASSKKPFLLRIPATGERPIEFSAKNLPDGLKICDNIIVGAVEEDGVYEVILTAKNSLGEHTKKLTLEIAPNNVLITPLLGFTTWNAFAEKVTQNDVLDTAKSMVKYGLTEYGYSYVNVDSGWQYKYGGELDAIQPNPKFPDMKAMTDEIHSMGLKCGIYSTPMLTAWGCPREYTSIPGCTVGEPDIRFTAQNGGIGVDRKEKNNAKQWEAWGFDYLKYDWSPTDTVNAELMRQELLGLNRDFGFCVTVNALKQYTSYWSSCCNSYRDNPDSQGFWSNLKDIFNSYLAHTTVMTKGHYFDLDMLDVGNCVFKKRENFLTEDEMIVAYSMRAFFNSPIQLSTVLTDPSEFELDLYCNEEIISINQDTAFSHSLPVFQKTDGGSSLYIFEKKLEDGNIAYALFNMGDCEEAFTVKFEGQSDVRDVWSKENIGITNTLSFSMTGHTVRIIKGSSKLENVYTKKA